ncbi:MAG: hypothetical protein ACXW30_02670 [Micavibrio sp.]
MSTLSKPKKKEESAIDEKPIQDGQFGATAGGWAQAGVIRLPDKKDDTEQ